MLEYKIEILLQQLKGIQTFLQKYQEYQIILELLLAFVLGKKAATVYNLVDVTTHLF